MTNEKNSRKLSLQVEPADVNDICSLQDVLEYEKETSEVANAVLGASDPINCSYNNGYVYRQALYSCLTCLAEKKSSLTSVENDEKNFQHGICLACSYECHENHELIELYTKRLFRCDCGNSKLPNSCKLVANKEPLNDGNKYNHNFNGKYCVCDRPYPETRATSGETDEEYDEDMIQCAICEDWYHQNHLKGGNNFPSENDYEEMICQDCMFQNKFLWNYQGYIAFKAELDQSSDPENDSLNVEKVDEGTSEKQITATECFLKRQKLKNISLNTDEKDQACCFLPSWRKNLCKCTECLFLYEKNNIRFLLEEKDSVSFYENLGKSKQPSESDENKIIDNQLSQMSRVSRVEFLHGVNDFKTELSDFLAGFATKGEVVKRENIDAFFEDLARKKRQRMDAEKYGNVANFYCQ